MHARLALRSCKRNAVERRNIHLACEWCQNSPSLASFEQAVGRRDAKSLHQRLCFTTVRKATLGFNDNAREQDHGGKGLARWKLGTWQGYGRFLDNNSM